MTLAPPLHRSRGHATACRSFTLVEVLAAVALLAMLTTGLTSLSHTLRASATMLRSLPELDRTRTTLADELLHNADARAHAMHFPSSFLAEASTQRADASQRTAGPAYVWLVHSRRGVSATRLAPRAALPGSNASSPSLTQTPPPNAPPQSNR